MNSFYNNQRILWIYPKLDKWMGGSRFVFECSKRLNKKYKVIVISQVVNETLRYEFKKNGIQIYDLKSMSFTNLTFWLKFNKVITESVSELEKLVNDSDLIITSMFPANYIASYFPNRCIQIIYEPFSFFYRKDLKKDYGILVHIFFKIITKYFSKYDHYGTNKANKVLVLSNYEKNNVKNIYNVDSQIIYEGVDINHFHPQYNTSLENKYFNKIPIMHSTGFDLYKGTDFLIYSLPYLKKEIKNFILLITFTRRNKSKIKRYIKYLKKNSLDENVEFLGFIPYECLPMYYTIAKIYIEPGIGRSMSLSNKEAMACGTPVIKGNDENEEVIDGFNGFTVNTESPLDLVEKIKSILSDELLYNNMSNNAINFIKEKYLWESVVDKIENNIRVINDKTN